MNNDTALLTNEYIRRLTQVSPVEMDISSLREVIICTAKLKPQDITLPKLQECLQAVHSYPVPPEESVGDVLWISAVRYCSVLTEFAEKGLVELQNSSTDSAEVVNLHDLSQFLSTIDLVRQFSLQLYLPREMRGLSKCEAQLMVKVEEAERVRRLSYCVDQFRHLFEKKMLALHPRLEECAVDFIAGSYSLCRTSLMEESKLPVLSKERIFRSLLVIKSSADLPLDLAKVVHRDLLHLTGEPGGFSVLCRTLLTVGHSKDETPAWHKSEVIAKIVSSKGHTKKFYRQVLNDCFDFYRWAVATGTEESLIYASTCIECLKRIYQLPIAYCELHKRIEASFFGFLREIANPPEVITGCIVGERDKLLLVLHECHMAFSGSSLSSMPSSMLVPYIHLLVKLYCMLPKGSTERDYLNSLILFCVSNRSKKELDRLLDSFLSGFPDGETGNYSFHPRVVINHAETGDNYCLQIGPPSNDCDSDSSCLLPELVDVLKSSNRNILIYDTFLIFLSKLMSGTRTHELPEQQQLLDEGEREGTICKRFNAKYALIQALIDLISYKHFHNQLYDNPIEVLSVLTASLTKAVDRSLDAEGSISTDESQDILEVVISIFQEFLQRIRGRPEVEGVIKLLQRYRSLSTCSDATKRQIDLLCEATTSVSDDQSESACQNALNLCADQQPYCKVYGTTLLLKLLRERDPETIAQRHTILILALANLREEESYAFLNSVRLLVCLCDVLEAEVVDALVKEYSNEDNELDYRLKVGEAAVKTVETLGPFAVRYRDTLLNCFLAGTRHTADEFRASSLANVGTLCRILCYQVHHFFYELFTGIKHVLDADPYLPARRAAILVLSQLLEGIDGLMNFQEYLLLIYRFLKHVIATDNDDVTKLQAAVALDHLKTKTKDFLHINPVELEKRMFGRVI